MWEGTNPADPNEPNKHALLMAMTKSAEAMPLAMAPVL
jgi:hypothetical protein